MKTLSKKTLTKSWLNWVSFGQQCYNYEIMQGLGFTSSMLPVIEELYPDDKEAKREAIERHLTYYNTENNWGAAVSGIVASMEEERANGADISDGSINSLKAALSGPLAGIGDSFFWGTFRMIACGVGAPMAAEGNIVGVILYLLLNLIPSTLTRWYGFKLGYAGGRQFLSKIQADGTLAKMTDAAKVLAMVVIGGMIPQIVKFPIALTLEMGGGQFVLADVLEGIMPNLLPLLLSIFVYRFIMKGVKPNTIIFSLLGLGIVLTLLGVM